MTRYRTKPFEVEAVQWRGDNLEEVTATFPEVFWNVDRQALFYAAGGHHYRIPEGHYFLTRGGFNPWAIDPNTFEANYHVVEDE